MPFGGFFSFRFSRFHTPNSLISTGADGERIASRFLKGLGYRILHQGYRTQWSEIDLVALDQKTIVFVEVKTWSRAGEGGPSDAVHQEKQQRLTRASLAYLKKHHLLEHRCRFDVIEVLLHAPGKSPSIRHFKSAFEAQGRHQMFS